MNERLRLALQKSGRLSEESFDLLKQCGIDFHIKRQLIYNCQNFALDILLVRDDDIPGLIMQDICDIGIVGQNVLEEYVLERKAKGLPSDYKTLKMLPFGQCHLSLALPKESEYRGFSQLENKRIATSYPYILQDFLTKNNINATIVELSGSVEIAPRIGIADMICDLVSTGATLKANGLKEVEVIFKSQALLIQKEPSPSSGQQQIINSLMSRLSGIIQAKESKYIMLHAPKDKVAEIVKLLPGVEHPTIIPLKDDTQVALHAVCYESVFWETMESIKAKGASAILVMPIEKMLI